MGTEAAGATWAASLQSLERIRYLTVDVRGQLAVATGLLMVPKGTPPAGGWPIVAWAHGTSGVADQCAPSRNPEPLARMLAFSNLGFVVAAPDYEGLGTDGPHPYLNLDSEARSVIYAVKAARQRLPDAGSRWATIGHSQGGHAALGAGELAASLAPELSLMGTVAFAPASSFKDVAQWMYQQVDIWDNALGKFDDALALSAEMNGLVCLVAYGINATDPTFQSNRLVGVDLNIFIGQVESLCPDDFGKHIAEDVVRTIRFGRGIGTFKTFTPGWETDPAVVSYFTVNQPGNRPSAAPVLILQGDDDLVVPRRGLPIPWPQACALAKRIWTIA